MMSTRIFFKYRLFFSKLTISTFTSGYVRRLLLKKDKKLQMGFFHSVAFIQFIIKLMLLAENICVELINLDRTSCSH